MKRLLSLVVLFVFVLVYTSCVTTPPLKVTGSWIDKEKMLPGKYHSIFLLVLTPNFEAREIIENELANAAKAKGITVVKSIDVYPPFNTKESTPSEEMILKKVAEKNCETIFVTTLVDAKSETKYVPGTSVSYNPYPYYGHYGTFGGYYGYYNNYAYSPGYYSTDNTYFLESNLYDAKTHELLISIQSKAVNPPQIQKSASMYAQQLVEEIGKYGLKK